MNVVTLTNLKEEGKLQVGDKITTTDKGLCVVKYFVNTDPNNVVVVAEDSTGTGYRFTFSLKDKVTA